MLRPLVTDVEGTGPPVVLLHGQPGTSAHWWRVAPLLRDRWTVIAPDRPGYGRTGGPAGDFTANAAAVVALLDDLGIDAAVVVGHSWAAPVATCIAVDAPDRVTGLVLVSPPVPGSSIGVVDRLLATPPWGALSALATIGVGGRVLGPARRVVHGVLPEASWDTLGHISPGPGAWRAFAAEQQTYVSQLGGLADGLGRISAPTRVVAGSADHVVGVDAGRLVASRIPGARLHSVAGGSHLLPWEHPGAVVAAIDELAPW